MLTSLDSSRNLILEATLSLTWRQWTLLGVPGNPISEKRQFTIIDPESLILVTTEIGRFDARLFDEMLNWLRVYGRLVNIQRLKSLHVRQNLGNRAALASIASTLMEASRLAKWNAIESLAKPVEGDESLFRSLDGSPKPIFGEADPHFAKYGLFRGNYVSRLDATAPKVELPELLLIKLRALLGVNARAEVIAALLSVDAAHPSALARQIGYLPRSIQDLLNEMALSGHVSSNRSSRSREKYFSLRPGDWTFLITWPEPKRFPQWVQWPILFSLLQESIASLFHEHAAQESSLMCALRLHRIFDTYMPDLSQSGLSRFFRRSSQESGEQFLETFLQELTTLRE